MTIREKGRGAYDMNFHIDDCPYLENTKEWRQWRAGWRDRDFEVSGDSVTGEYGLDRTHFVKFSVSESERSRITLMAAAQKMNVSAYIRFRLFGA